MIPYETAIFVYFDMSRTRQKRERSCLRVFETVSFSSLVLLQNACATNVTLKYNSYHACLVQLAVLHVFFLQILTSFRETFTAGARGSRIPTCGAVEHCLKPLTSNDLNSNDSRSKALEEENYWALHSAFYYNFC